MTDMILGKIIGTNDSFKIDLPRLIDSRLLVQANSGGGKSWALRKLLETTHGKVQHIILDPEGEFTTLREKYDYLIVAKEGDIPVSIKTAELLARKVLEINVSVIIDLYELSQYERILFVKRFLDSLINAPKELWHPALVIVDEAHQFCPEKGNAESADSVKNLATKGRKRGFCAVLATQRLSKLSKDAAAELNNKLIGRTGLDVDMKRAGEELGFSSKEDVRNLRSLQPGEFHAFGPAFSQEVIKVKVGDVQTTHPKVGNRLLTQVAVPRGEVLKALEKLKDLPKETEKELRTKQEFEAEIRSLKAQLGATKRIVTQPVKPSVVELDRARKQGYLEAEKVYRAHVSSWEVYARRLWNMCGQIKNSLEHYEDMKEPKGNFEFKPSIPNTFVSSRTINMRKIEVKSSVPIRIISDEELRDLSVGALKILKALAMFSPESLSKSQIGIMTGYSASSGTFSNYLSEVRSRGLIQQRGKEIFITEQGVQLAGEVEPLPNSHEDILDLWEEKLGKSVGKLLRVIASRYPEEITKEELGNECGFSYTSGTFSNYLSELRSAGVITTEGQIIRPNKFLFLEK